MTLMAWIQIAIYFAVLTALRRSPRPLHGASVPGGADVHVPRFFDRSKSVSTG